MKPKSIGPIGDTLMMTLTDVKISLSVFVIRIESGDVRGKPKLAASSCHEPD